MRYAIAPLAAVSVAVFGFTHVSNGDVASAEKALNKECSTALYENLGDHHFPITTDSKRAQAYFDQALTWAFGFNHPQAERFFREAIRLDPDCAMCYWGVAYVLGPNINAPMNPEKNPEALAAVKKAQSLAENATARERHYIQAMAQRYAPDTGEDRSALDQAYADAMQRVAFDHPGDTNAQTLYAEALMDTTPWNYWTKEGTPKPVTKKILAALRRALEVDPNNPGANHFLIHTVEAVRPKRGLGAAARLKGAVPDAGHLVHMPGHIYLRVGRYHEASKANQRAIAADKRHLERCPVRDFYSMMYVPHNYDFLIATSSFEGRSALALETSHELARYAARLIAGEDGAVGVDLQQFRSTPLLTQVMFGRWEAILETPEPPKDHRYARALWHYARAMAQLRQGDTDEAAQDVQRLSALAESQSMQEALLMAVNPAADVLKVALAEVRGELAAARGNFEEAIKSLKIGVQAQDDLVYMEPPPWYRSLRLNLGAVLLEAQRPKEAEASFRKSLERFPKNGWALKGLFKALVDQKRFADAKRVLTRFRKATAYADVNIPAGRF